MGFGIKRPDISYAVKDYGMDFRTERLLEAAKAKLWSPDIIVEASGLRVAWCGDRIQKELGYAAEDIVGVSLREFVVLDGPGITDILFNLLSKEQTLIVTAIGKGGKQTKLRIMAESLAYEGRQYILGKIV